MRHNTTVNRTPCRPCRQVPSALRAPVAGYLRRWAQRCRRGESEAIATGPNSAHRRNGRYTCSFRQILVLEVKCADFSLSLH